MKTQLFWMIFGAFLLGIIIGILVTGRYTRHKVVQIKEMGTPEGMHKRFYKLIEPDDVQRTGVKSVLKEYAAQSESLRLTHWQEQKQLYEEMVESLTPMLNQDQIERLQRFQERSRLRKHKKPDGYKPGKREHFRQKNTFEYKERRPGAESDTPIRREEYRERRREHRPAS